MGIALGLLAALALLALLYWLFVVGEATYLGRYAVRFIYQRGAPHYDRVRRGVTDTDERVLLPLFSSALEPFAAPRVLDVATGTGRVPLLLARQPWFTGHVVGLDLTPAMLEQARLQVAKFGIADRVTLIEGDADTLPWPAEEFDLVVSLEALEFFPSSRRALAEMARVLRPDGTLVVSKYPDGWARLLPFKGQTRRSITRFLEAQGMQQISIYDWQIGHYELVVARKRS